MAREWIIFAICVGLGGHVALGILLHGPQAQSVSKAGLNGLLAGIGIYIAVQVVRFVWWFFRARPDSEPDPPV